MTLSFDPNTISLPVGHFIGGRLVPAEAVIGMHRPSDGKAYAGCPLADEALVDQAVETARTALKTSNWGGVRPRERTVALQRWADLIEAEAETSPGSKRFLDTARRPSCRRRYRRHRRTDPFLCRIRRQGRRRPRPDRRCELRHDHDGTPWRRRRHHALEFPVSMAGWKLGPALAAGNAVVLKPSEMTPFSTLYLAELSVRAGLPAGLVNIVLGDGPTTGNAITGHPGISKVSFTGSTAAGSAIMINIARTGVKPMTLELGGKSPQLVFADADLELAAGAIAGSILSNAGQACVCGSRLIVEAKVADALAAALIERLAAIRPGPTWDEATDYSPVISERQIARMDGIIRAAIDGGAECLTGGRRLDREGYFYAPTLISGVTATSPAVLEEIFGPVLTMQTFEDEEEALGLADHPAYGLAAGLFTRDLSRAIRVTRRLQAGTVWVNRYGRSRDHILPTGGYKQSGIGKDLGRDAYLANRKSKSVLISL